MLKLKKSRKEISISLSGKEPFFNYYFLCAFGAAFGLHLFAFILFRIHPFFITDDRILKPISVETDLTMHSQPDIGVQTALGEENGHLRHLSNPPFSHPELPTLPQISTARGHHFLVRESSDIYPFLQIEEEWNGIVPSLHTTATTLPALTVSISGLLADYLLIDDGTAHITDTLMLKEPKRLVYSVQMEGKTGKIFWHQLQNDSGSQNVARLAETILRNIKFKEDPQLFALGGEVEIFFSPSMKDIQ